MPGPAAGTMGKGAASGFGGDWFPAVDRKGQGEATEQPLHQAVVGAGAMCSPAEGRRGSHWVLPRDSDRRAGVGGTRLIRCVMGADHQTHSVMAEWASLWFICIPEALTLPMGDTPKTGRFSSTINNKCVVVKQ